MAVLLVAPLPLVLLLGWVVMWQFRSPARWLSFFGASLGLMVVVACGSAVRSNQPCTDSGLACVSDSSFFLGISLLLSFPLWLVLIIVTAIAEAAHAAAPEKPRPGGDEDEPYDRFPGIML
jgi:hypothetical protein